MILVTFEGIDGSGKSTQAQRLVARLRESGKPVRQVREPGGSDLSERIRSLLLDPALTIHPMSELMLFAAARAQLVEECIRPALAEGKIVVCDRFYDSTTAYQGGGRQVVEWDWVRSFHAHVTGGLQPDRTYLIRLDPEAALRRRSGGADADRMEQADAAFYRRVVRAYDRLAEEEPERILCLDGRRDIDELAAEVWDDLRAVLERRQGTAPSG